MNTNKGNCISCGVPKYLHGTCCGWANSNTIVKPLTDVERYYQSLQKKAGNYINVSNSPMKDKQTQTVYVEVSDTEYFSEETKSKMLLSKCDSVYIHTPEELAQAFREVAEKAIDKGIGIGRRALIGAPYYPSDEKYIKEETESYLNQHYPLPQPINS